MKNSVKISVVLLWLYSCNSNNNSVNNTQEKANCKMTTSDNSKTNYNQRKNWKKSISKKGNLYTIKYKGVFIDDKIDIRVDLYVDSFVYISFYKENKILLRDSLQRRNYDKDSIIDINSDAENEFIVNENIAMSGSLVRSHIYALDKKYKNIVKQTQFLDLYNLNFDLKNRTFTSTRSYFPDEKIGLEYRWGVNYSFVPVEKVTVFCDDYYENCVRKIYRYNKNKFYLLNKSKTNQIDSKYKKFLNW